MKKYLLLFILILCSVQSFGQGIFWTYPMQKLTSYIYFSESGSGTSTIYITGRYNLTVSAPDGYNSINAVIYNSSMGYMATEYSITETGRLVTPLKSGYIVYFYVDEVAPIVYSDAIDHWFIANDGHCGVHTCPPSYTWMAIYHMVDSGTFTGATKAEANAARDAWGQALANAAECQCIQTGPI